MNRSLYAAQLIVAALLGALLITALPAATSYADSPAASVAANDCDTGRTIQVSGAATVNVVPDRALVWLGVQSTDRAPDRAQALNQAAIERVIVAIRQLGVAERDITTDVYMVTPVYDSNGTTIVSYRVENSVAVTLRDINLVSPVIVASFKAGANQVSDVQLYSSELRRYRDQARELAMKAALEKAQALASAAGAHTGCVLSISENSWSYYGGWGQRQSTPWTQNVVQNAPSNEGPIPGEPPVSVGQIAVHAEISAQFSLEP